MTLDEFKEMYPDEAAEFIDYNTIGAYFGEGTPIVIYPVEQ